MSTKIEHTFFPTVRKLFESRSMDKDKYNNNNYNSIAAKLGVPWANGVDIVLLFSWKLAHIPLDVMIHEPVGCKWQEGTTTKKGKRHSSDGKHHFF